MNIGGVSIIFILGVVNLILVLSLILSEYGIVSVSKSLHRALYIILFSSALIHGTLAMLVND